MVRPPSRKDPHVGEQTDAPGHARYGWGSGNGRWSGALSLHASRTDGFIYLRPEGYRLTIRGAFPVFRYTATDVLMWGTDAQVRFRPVPAWTIEAAGGLVRAGTWGSGRMAFQVPRTVPAWPWDGSAPKARPAFHCGGRALGEGAGPRTHRARLHGPAPGYALLALDLLVERPLGKDRMQLGMGTTC